MIKFKTLIKILSKFLTKSEFYDLELFKKIHEIILQSDYTIIYNKKSIRKGMYRFEYHKIINGEPRMESIELPEIFIYNNEAEVIIKALNRTIKI